nr:MAG TPA: hypothetical protein [Caudoviricetes sp.]
MGTLQILISGGLLVYGFHFLCVLTETIGKCVLAKICKDYSDTKTKALAKMFTRIKKVFKK